MQTTLDARPKQIQARNDQEKKSVKTYLDTITNSILTYANRISDYQAIFDLFAEGIEIREPNGARRVDSLLLQQALWKVVGRFKPLDFAVYGSQRPPMVRSLVRDGISTVMDRGGFLESLRDKGGAFLNMALLGDGMIQFGLSPDEDDFPIQFQSVPLGNVYVDPYAVKMRGKSGQSVTKMVLIFSYPWAEAIKMYPKLEKIGGAGLIPRQKIVVNETNRNYEQSTEINDQDTVEIAYGYDITNDNYTIFAGSNCTILEEYNGDKYPFKQDGCSYIPVMHLYLQPAMEGFWNYGLGHLLYRIAIIQRQLMNMELGHIYENTWPTTIVNLPANQSERFFSDLAAAEEDKANGRRGFVTVEYDATGANSVQAQTLIAQNLFNEWKAVWDQFTQTIARLGVNLDEIDRGANVTASQIIAEEESSNAFVKQVMEYNASEFKFAVEMTMNLTAEHVSAKNKTPLNTKAVVDVNALKSLEIEDVTLGEIAEELKEHHYFVEINARSGAYPSLVLEQAYAQKAFGVLPPGSPAQLKQSMNLARMYGVEVSPEDLGIQEALPKISPEAAESDVMVSETDRLRVNPRSATPTPAI